MRIASLERNWLTFWAKSLIVQGETKFRPGNGCQQFCHDSGQWVGHFYLTNFLCPANKIYSLPINVLATPISTKLFFLTLQHELVNNGTDVKITVFAWNANGGPAAGVVFNWRCRVELPIIIL
ncbi:MAG TPA: hypothetical protein VFT48_16215 [Pyrinomonadaceae bacterium]|nr:hypothetical protein [Pyrinomonadaceae bacterium]